jgi:hypothetical protein
VAERPVALTPANFKGAPLWPTNEADRHIASAKAHIAAHERDEAALSNLSTIVGPVQQCLPLPLAAGEVALFTMPLDLRGMPFDLLPASDLPRVFLRQAAPHVVAAVPLKPAARIVRMQPALPAPQG